MKLETTLDERPGFLHTLPLFDMLMLLVMLLMVGPMFLSQSGVSVELPASRFQMQRYGQSIVVTVGAGDSEPRLHIGRQSVTMDGLRDRLEELRSDEVMSRAVVLLKSDVGAAVGVQREVAEMILGTGFKLALVGRSSIDSESGNESEFSEEKAGDD